MIFFRVYALVNYLINFDIFICIISKHPQFVVVLGIVSRALGKGDNIASQCRLVLNMIFI